MSLISTTEKHHQCPRCGNSFFAPEENIIIVYYGVLDKDNNIIFKRTTKAQEEVNMICTRCGQVVNPDIIVNIE